MNLDSRTWLEIHKMPPELIPEDPTGMKRRIILSVNSIISRKHCCHEWVYLVCNNVQVAHRHQGLFYWVMDHNVLYKNVAHPILYTPQACLWPTVHPGARVSLRNQRIRTRTLIRRTREFHSSDNVIFFPLLNNPIPMFMGLLQSLLAMTCCHCRNMLKAPAT